MSEEHSASSENSCRGLGLGRISTLNRQSAVGAVFAQVSLPDPIQPVPRISINYRGTHHKDDTSMSVNLRSINTCIRRGINKSAILY